VTGTKMRAGFRRQLEFDQTHIFLGDKRVIKFKLTAQYRWIQFRSGHTASHKDKKDISVPKQYVSKAHKWNGGKAPHTDPYTSWLRMVRSRNHRAHGGVHKNHSVRTTTVSLTLWIPTKQP
jgi:hypothetical protein